jgi:hypothetical protein
VCEREREGERERGREGGRERERERIKYKSLSSNMRAHVSSKNLGKFMRKPIIPDSIILHGLHRQQEREYHFSCR